MMAAVKRWLWEFSVFGRTEQRLPMVSIPVFRDPPADWLSECERLLFDLHRLAPNWDSYDADPVDRESVRQASVLLRALAVMPNIESPTVTATPDGNAAFCWDDGERSLDLEIQASGVVEYAYLDEVDDSKDEEGQTKDILSIAHLLLG